MLEIPDPNWCLSFFFFPQVCNHGKVRRSSGLLSPPIADISTILPGKRKNETHHEWSAWYQIQDWKSLWGPWLKGPTTNLLELREVDELEQTAPAVWVGRLYSLLHLSAGACFQETSLYSGPNYLREYRTLVWSSVCIAEIITEKSRGQTTYVAVDLSSKEVAGALTSGLWTGGSESVGPGSGALASPGNWLEMRITRPHPRPPPQVTVPRVGLAHSVILQEILTQSQGWGSLL